MSGNLSSQDADVMGTRFGHQSIHRMNGPATTVGILPGVYPGVEFLMIITPSMKSLGDRKGQLTRFMPIPRLFVTKGLPLNIEVNFHFLPAFVMPFYHGWGASIKWNPLTEENAFAALALKASYEFAGFVSNGVRTSTFALDAIISQDLVSFVPYGGIGVLHTSAEIKSQWVKPGVANQYEEFALHVFAGVVFNTPLTFSVEMGLSGSSFYLGATVGKNLFDERHLVPQA